MADCDDALCWVQKQYFQALAMKNFDWKKLDNLTCEDSYSNFAQAEILNGTVLHPLSQKYPPSKKYKLSFLKSLLAVFQKKGWEVCDELYNLIAELMATAKSSEDEFIYKSYILPCGQAVTLCESAQFVSQGTTGLNTWQAGLFLSNWLIQNKALLEGKTVLELGCGVGLTGLVALHCCRPKSFIFTDSNENVLQKVKENLQINGYSSEQHKDGLEVCFKETTRVSQNFFGSQNVSECWTCTVCEGREQCSASVCQLDWERCSVEEIKTHCPDVILASDVIFDPQVIESLVNVLNVFLSQKVNDEKCHPVGYIASTIRNTETYEKFLVTLGKFNIKRNQIYSVPDEFFLYDKTSEIVLYQLQPS